jgi:hypothetical protein
MNQVSQFSSGTYLTFTPPFIITLITPAHRNHVILVERAFEEKMVVYYDPLAFR